MLREYYRLTKPGIVYANVLTAVAGFLLASGTHVEIRVLLAMVFGIGLIIVSACVANNYMDRSVDAMMKRTRRRALVTGTIKPWQASVFMLVAGVAGVVLLIAGTNMLTLTIGLVAFVDYVFLYGWAKRRTALSTLVGSISGSACIVAGYTSVVNRFDATALMLFVMMTAWQMPHFYAIAVHRQADYRQAGLPVLSVVRGTAAARRHSVVYMVLFLLAVVALRLTGSVGSVFVVVVGIAGLYWLYTGLRPLDSTSPDDWARRVFKTSLTVMMTMSCMVALGGILP